MMNIIECTDYSALSSQAAKIVIDQLTRKPNSLVCAATGNSPTGLYQQLARIHCVEPQLFSQMRVIKLDEWLGLSMDDPSTCESYLHRELLVPLGVPPSNYIAFDSNPENAAVECERIQRILNSSGPIDLCILGLGSNGHLALIEPGNTLIPHCHIATLAHETREHAMLKQGNTKVRQGLTIGIADILASQAILLLITGAKKTSATEQLLKPAISTHCPASLLWLHKKVNVLIDASIFSE